MRTIIDLPEKQRESLDQLCTKQKLSRAEAIRQAVDLFLEQHQTQPEADTAFGLWKDRQEDGLDYQQKLRDEWE